jgi:hypothetical protein
MLYYQMLMSSGMDDGHQAKWRPVISPVVYDMLYDYFVKMCWYCWIKFDWFNYVILWSDVCERWCGCCYTKPYMFMLYYDQMLVSGGVDVVTQSLICLCYVITRCWWAVVWTPRFVPRCYTRLLMMIRSSRCT